MSQVIRFLRQLQDQGLQKGLEGELEDLMQEAWEKHQEVRSDEHLETLHQQGFRPDWGESLPTWAKIGRAHV